MYRLIVVAISVKSDAGSTGAGCGSTSRNGMFLVSLFSLRVALIVDSGSRVSPRSPEPGCRRMMHSPAATLRLRSRSANG